MQLAYRQLCDLDKTNRKASHKISTHEAQFDTMRSPAPGRHDSRDPLDRLVSRVSTYLRLKVNTNPRLRDTCSTRIHHKPRTNNDNLDRSAVRTYEIALCTGGIGLCASEGVTTEVEGSSYQNSTNSGYKHEVDGSNSYDKGRSNNSKYI